jgi:invasion protein IalB
MTYRNMSGSVPWARRAAIAGLVGTALMGLAIGSAVAQQPPPAAPKPAAPAAKPPAPRPVAPKPPAAAPAAPQSQAPAPAAPQAQAGAPGAPPDMPQLIYSPWAKFCGKGNDANAKEVCFTGKDARTEDGRPVIAAALIEPEGEPKKLFRVTLPMPVQLPYGARIVIDKEPALTGAFFTCFPNGCMAEFEGTAELIGKLKKGQTLSLQAINLAGNPFSFPLPLAADSTGNSFAKANEGPPIDPKVFEEQQTKLQQELQKRADEARKKLESQGGGTPGAPK